MPDRPPVAPGRRPFVGHTFSVLGGPLDALTRWGRLDQDLLRLGVAGRRFCLVTHPGLVEEVLAVDTGQYRKAEVVRDRLGRLQGGSLVLLEGEAWQSRRETLGPAFAGEAVERAGPATTKRARERIDGWPATEQVDLRAEARRLVLSLLGETLFGLELSGRNSPIHEAADDIMARMDLRSPSAYLPAWVPTPTNYRFRRAVSRLHDRLDAVVAAADEGQTPNLFAVMLAAGLSDDQVRDELIALLFAGYDSTATALSLTLGLLAANPAVQSALRTELDTVLGGDAPTVDALPDLPVLDAVVREGLRLYPPQYLLFRQPEATVTLGGFEVDEGTTLLLPPWVLQRHPEYWDDPRTFRPTRWLGETRDRPEYAYFPYGGGPRYCLGARLATQTLKLVVAVVCRRRRLELDGTPSVRAGPTLMPDPIDVLAEPVEE